MTWTSIILIASNLASYLLLSSNDRFSSFYWIRGSKYCFLTSFSNLNCYLLFLVFLRNCYLIVSSCLSRLHKNPISSPVSHTFGSLRYYVAQAPPYFWHTSRIFLKQDARQNLVLESVPIFFPFSAFCRRFLMQTSIGRSRIIPFLLTQNTQTDTFLHDISLH